MNRYTVTITDGRNVRSTILARTALEAAERAGSDAIGYRRFIGADVSAVFATAVDDETGESATWPIPRKRDTGRR